MITTLITALLLAPVGGSFDIPPTMLPAKPAPTTVMATVDGVPIKQSEMDALVWDLYAQTVLDEMITYQLIINEAKRQKITVTQKQILDAVNKGITEFNAKFPKPVKDDTELRKSGFPKSRLYLYYQSKLLSEKLLSKSFNKADYIKISGMSFPVLSQSATDLGDTSKKAQAAYEQLIKTEGKDWEKVLATTTTEVSIIKNKGAMGWKYLSAFPKQIREEFKTLKVGGITKPILIQSAFQIFRVEVFGKDAAGPELETLKSNYLQYGLEAYLKELRQKAKIVKK